MKLAITLSFLAIGSSVFSQLRTTFNQYMLNPALVNPGFMDVQTRFGGALTYRKQWLSAGETPVTFAANGYYRLTRNHGVGMIVTNDRVGNINTLEVGLSYTYHLWITNKIALGLGVKAGFNQRSMQSDYVYFGDGADPVLANLKTGGINVGTGLSLQSKNFTFGVSVPYLFNNSLNGPYAYVIGNNHFYTHMSYKLHASDNFVFVPSILLKGVSGAPLSMSFDGHVLINQLVWLGGGYRSDNTVGLSAGLFFKHGLRVVYSYETAYFSAHTRFNSTHEISLNYAQSIEELPFQLRLYRKKNGKMYKRPDPNNRKGFGN